MVSFEAGHEEVAFYLEMVWYYILNGHDDAELRNTETWNTIVELTKELDTIIAGSQGRRQLSEVNAS